MKWCVQFPEEEILIMRPCLKRACTGNKHAAALLSYLLYHVSISQEFRKTTEQQHQSKALYAGVQNSPVSISIYKTQQQILAEMDYDISERTLRSIAIPILVAHGYIDIDGSKKTTRYTVHLTRIQTGIMAHPPKAASLPASDQRVQVGNSAASYRQTCHHHTANLPPHTGKPAGFSGNLAGIKNGDESTPEGTSSSILSEDKSKSNKDIMKRRKEATKESTSHVSELEDPKATALPHSHDISGSTVTPAQHDDCSLQTQAREHKRAKQPEGSKPGSPIQHSHGPSSSPKVSLTGSEAQELVLQVMHDGKQHGYPIQAQSICKDNIWLVAIQLEQYMFCIHNAAEWKQRLAQIHQIMQINKKLNHTASEEQTSWSA